MNVTIRQLTVMEAVARNLSFTKAAEELHLTQPAVSMQIKQLEEVVGLPMFEQIGKKVFLTEAGKEMYGYSRNIQQQLIEAQSVIENLKGLRSGRLTIAVASTANYFVPRLLARFNEKYDAITVSLDVTNRAGLLTHLDRNDTDVVIMGEPPQTLDLDYQTFMSNPLVVIAPTNHPLRRVSSIPIATLSKETFIVREKGSGTRTSTERFFADYGLEISTSMTMSSNEAIKQAVQAGLGLGIVSMHTLEQELELQRLVILDVEMFPIERSWYLVHRKGKRLSPVAVSFKKFILNSAKEYIEQSSTAALDKA